MTLHFRKLLSARVIVSVIVIAVIAVGVFAYILIPRLGPAPPTKDHIAMSVPTADDPNTENPVLARLYKADNQILMAASKVARSDSSSPPRIITVKSILGSRQVLIVPGLESNPRTYELSRLAKQVPEAITLNRSGIATIKLPTVIGDGVRLVVDVRSTPIVRLASSDMQHASLTGLRGQVILRGTANKKLSITSVVATTSEPDHDETNGRPFIRTKGGRLEVRNTHVSDLGYYIGETSGLSWMSGSGTMAKGGSWDSIFTRNHFGAYSSKAVGLQIIRTQFLNNRYYGFDPHTDTIRTVVRHSRASGNGRHGIIFSKGCNDNIIESTVSVGNGGAGFMIDDGNPRLNETRTSNRNLLRSIVASNNGGPGVIVEGGDRNIVNGAMLANNRIGYWARANATRSRLQNATIDASLQAAIRIDGNSVLTSVDDVKVDGAQTGLWFGSSQDSAVTNADLIVRGTAIRMVHTAINTQLTNIEIEGSGPRPISGASPENLLPDGVTVTSWKTVQNRSFVSEFIEFFLHPFAIVTWTIILVPPILAVIGRAHRFRKRVSGGRPTVP